jgi:hypothetical protein
MGKFKFKKICVTAVGLLLSLFYSSCQDELLSTEDGFVEEGKPATVTLKFKVNDLDVMSRSIIDEASAHFCDNLWIGLYSKSTGERLDYIYDTNVANTDEVPGQTYDLSFNTNSANEVYIVAVANSDVNSGVESIDKYGSNSSTLRKMLDDATTFDKFTAICMLRPDASDVNIYANTLTMSGWYSEDDSYDPSNIPTVNIAPGINNLSGTIKLRRLIAYNKFIIAAGDNVNLKLESWKVCNIPAGCYLFEQTDNAGDHYTGSEKFYNSSLASHLFTITTDSVTGKTGHYFEFYQVENKHTATDYAADGTDHVGIDESVGAAKWYNEREREFKQNNLNTGIYRSLVKADKSNISNNNATYVVVTANIDYYVAAPTDGSDFDPDTAVPVDPAVVTNNIHRTAKVEYTIHLGYCEDKDSNGDVTYKTAQDFNCLRNTKYTYNVTINGVKNVVVEARSEDGSEPQPGAEGWVTDETGAYEELDSHYCEFNISLTDAEREKMSYRITAPYNNTTYYYERDKNGDITMTKGMNEALYSWIKFYPTSDKNTLAEFNAGKGKNTKGEGDGLWTFNDMCTPTVKPNNMYDADDDGKKWYTVFIDEYVYHFDDQGNAETSWPYYANQDDRMAEFIMNEAESKDTESTYTYCKYAFAQKSIQTYYKGSNVGDKAIGIEHIEETYCLNMDWNFQTGWGNERNYSYDTGAYNADSTKITQKFYDFTNGRYNQWKYLQSKNITEWSAVIQPTVPGHVSGYTSEKYGCSHPDADYPVYMPKPYTTTGSGRYSNSPSLNDNNVYYANSICMNRNRDLNGNGIIDDNEIRWYLPTSSDYIQIAICQGELPDPIIKFSNYSPAYFDSFWAKYFASVGSDRQKGGRYGTYNFHYITSDYQYYFAEQLAATGDYPFEGYVEDLYAAYTARCIRNLGTDLGTPAYGVNEVDNAFSYDATTRTFNQYNFRDEQLRGYTLGGLAPHNTASVTSHPYKKFQVAANKFSGSDEYIKFNSNLNYNVSISANTGDAGELAGTRNDLLDKTTAWANSLKKNGVCSQYTESEDRSDLGTWRIPSIGELALMWIEGLPQADRCSYLSATYDYFTSYKMRNLTGNNHLYLGFFNNNGDRQIISLDVLDQSNIQLRCVRDVK